MHRKHEKDFLKNEVDCFIFFVCQPFSAQLFRKSVFVVVLPENHLLFVLNWSGNLLDFQG